MSRERQTDVKPSKKGRTSCQAYKDEIQNDLFIFKQHCCHDCFARERVDDCGWGDGGSIVVRVRVEGRCLCTFAVDESKRFLAEVLTHTQ